MADELRALTRRPDVRRVVEWLDRPRVAVALSVAVLAFPILFALVVPHPLEQPLGVDFALYRDATARWLGGGPLYEPYQLAGPYPISAGDILYPPVALWLFVPFAIPTGFLGAAAAVGWWAIPLAVVGLGVAALRPRPLVWPLIALCASNPTTILKVWTGNPVIWAMAAMAVAVVGARWRFAAPFVVLKPSLAPFALFGVARRSWWAGAAVLAVLSAPFLAGGLWADWLKTLANSRGGGLLYSSLEAPMLLLPIVAWLGRRRRG
ncbi:MAG TPA: hypothetical protein VFP22_00500 [Candidatus Limnocylindrales bacterium]|nr:hypothetical protein [Candidatus Limnocylindrales bacterium]